MTAMQLYTGYRSSGSIDEGGTVCGPGSPVVSDSDDEAASMDIDRDTPANESDHEVNELTALCSTLSFTSNPTPDISRDPVLSQEQVPLPLIIMYPSLDGLDTTGALSPFARPRNPLPGPSHALPSAPRNVVRQAQSPGLRLSPARSPVSGHISPKDAASPRRVTEAITDSSNRRPQPKSPATRKRPRYSDPIPAPLPTLEPSALLSSSLAEDGGLVDPGQGSRSEVRFVGALKPWQTVDLERILKREKDALQSILPGRSPVPNGTLLVWDTG